MLGELPKDKGLINVTGRIAYVSQQPWVFSGTVRSNILFDKEYEKEKYEKVLKVCALKKVWFSLCFFICTVFVFILASFRCGVRAEIYNWDGLGVPHLPTL